jgi:hypothetical protein
MSQLRNPDDHKRYLHDIVMNAMLLQTYTPNFLPSILSILWCELLKSEKKSGHIVQDPETLNRCKSFKIMHCLLHTGSVIHKEQHGFQPNYTFGFCFDGSD